ncbi:MAG TPA: family 43 glycosylhydrolase, partial [Acidimicrobiales bacterium]|nr:family 43 glycosylhydrolase [Acidimicrobiales bacterium]
LYASSALPNPPAWEQTSSQTSPAVIYTGGHYVLWYDAIVNGSGGLYCLSVATSSSPKGPFVDTSHGANFCQPSDNGSIDPTPVLLPGKGGLQPWLVWKSNSGGPYGSAEIWSQPLDAAGTAFAAGTAGHVIFTQNSALYPWEQTVEQPDFIWTGSHYYLLYAGGIWHSNGYAEGIASCSGPDGPCTRDDSNPFLRSYGDVAGPGAASAFEGPGGSWYLAYAAWNSSCTNYGCGGARRLFVAPMEFGPLQITTGALPGATVGKGYTASLAYAAGGGLGSHSWKIASGRLPSGLSLDGATGSITGTPLATGTATFTVALSDSASPGPDVVAKVMSIVVASPPIAAVASTPDGRGYFLVAVNGSVFTYGDAHFYGDLTGSHLNAPIVAIAVDPATGGYWLLGGDGGVFSFHAPFFGSTGNIRLHSPAVGLEATPTGNGYRFVASDGGIFDFGVGAHFYGSMGGHHLNRPIVGMADDLATGGYWLVASDGGIFSFRAPFKGSTGNIRLNKPIIQMEALADGEGYRFVASDGGVFDFGAAHFAGALSVGAGSPVVGMAAQPGSSGYWLVQANGTVHAFGGVTVYPRNN